jgi:hypothetical protein
MMKCPPPVPDLGQGHCRPPTKKAAHSGGLFHHQRQRAYLVTPFRFAGLLLFVDVFTRAALAAAFRFAGVLLFAGAFTCAAWTAAFRFAGVLLFAGVFACAALAAFFVVFAIVITEIPVIQIDIANRR